MEKSILNKLADQTDAMYTALMGQMRHGFFALWNPRFQELHKIMEALLSDYKKCQKGKILQEQYQIFIGCKDDCELLEEEVFVRGDLEKMEKIQKRLSDSFKEAYQILKVSIKQYESIEQSIKEISVLEEEYENNTRPLVEEYMVKIKNRIQKNTRRALQFDSFSHEEKTDFIAHVILFDEGKLENEILSCLIEQEQKLEEAFTQLEHTAVISLENMSEHDCVQYIEKYRLKNEKKNPKEFSTSKQFMEAGEHGNKFEEWFKSLVGEESSIGKLIQEGSKTFTLPIEERMYEAINEAIEKNLGVLNMKPMLEAYEKECLELKEIFFEEFYGKYSEVKILKDIVAKANEIFPKWSVKDVGLAEIIMAE